MHTRSKVVVVVTLCSLFTLVGLLSPAAASEGAREPVKPLAEVAISASRVDWQPTGEHERLVLTVAGPGDLYVQREFGAGEAPSFSALDAQGGRLPDGVYAYELRAKGRQVQWGHLWAQGGSFMDKVPDPPRPVKPVESASKPPLNNVTANATVIPDDLVVQGQACIGADCGAGDATGPALKIKETHNYQILFDALNCCFPWEARWAIQANEPGFTGDFLIRTPGLIPFRISPNAPDNAFTVFANGNIGLGTLTPAVRLDVKANAAGLATERLQNSSATGYSGTEYLDNAGNVDLFFGVDNAASTTRLNSANNNPIVVLTNSVERIRVTSGGDVGLGTASPTEALHVNGSDGDTTLRVEETNGTSTIRTLLELSNNGGVRLNYVDNSLGVTWGANVIAGNYRLIKAGSGATAFELQGNGNLTIAGTLTQGSDRATKEAIIPVQPEEVLAKLMSLPISTWSRKDEDPKVRHLGPMAQDFSATFGLGEDNRHIAPLDMAGVSMASIQALHGKMSREMAEKDTEIEALRQRLAALEELISKLTAPQ